MDVGLPISGKDPMSAQSCICLFSSLYPPSMGGVETYTASVARELYRMGLDVIVVTCALNDDEGVFVEDGIKVLRLPCQRLLGGRYPIPQHSAAARSWWRWLEEKHIDFIEVHTRFYPLSAQALAFAERKGVVPVVLEHGSAHLTLGNRVADIGVQAIEHLMTRRCLRRPAHYYAVSRKASAWLKHFKIESHGELPNSINADSYANGTSQRNFRTELDISESTLLVAFVGRLVPEKGALALAEAAKALEGSDIVVAMGGDGPLSCELKKYEGSSLRLLGRLSRPDVAALLTQADVMCLPSRSEGFATSLLEAAACGTPAIVTNVGGVDELIPNDNFGIILSDASVRTLESTLRVAKANIADLRRKGKAVSQLVRAEYSWRKTAKRTLDACLAANRSRIYTQRVSSTLRT